MLDVRCAPNGNGWSCEVQVDLAGDRTSHSVSVRAPDLDRYLGPGNRQGEEEVEDLVRRSFEFLLEREPPGSILRRFDLAVINRYFPEYDEKFRR